MTNIKPYLAPEYQDLDILQFREVLLKNIFNVEDTSTIKEYVLTDEDWVRVEELRSKYFNNPDWNYGKKSKIRIQAIKTYTSRTNRVQLER